MPNMAEGLRRLIFRGSPRQVASTSSLPYSRFVGQAALTHRDSESTPSKCAVPSCCGTTIQSNGIENGR